MRWIVIALLFAAEWTHAADLTIFEVRKPIALSDKEVTQKDYYINAGSESGLQKGMIITVVRKIPLYDSYRSRSAGDLTVPVAKVKIIQVQEGLSVARFASEISRNEIPTLEENFVMIGDQLDLATATHEKKSADNEDADPAEPEKAKPVSQVPAVLPPPTAQVTSQKIEALSTVPKEKGPGIGPSEGPAIR